MKVRKALVDDGMKVEDAELQYVANTPIEITMTKRQQRKS